MVETADLAVAEPAEAALVEVAVDTAVVVAEVAEVAVDTAVVVADRNPADMYFGC